MRRFRVPALLLLALLAIVLLASRADETTDSSALQRDRDARDQPQEGDLLTASGVGSAPAAEPGLKSRSAPADAIPAHGPVTVQVLGPDDTPLPGTFVAYLKQEPNGTILAQNFVALSSRALEADTEGEVVFRDLPYDGTHVIVAFPADLVDPDVEFLQPAAGCETSVPVLGERVVYRAGVGHWLDVHVVDAERGTSLPLADVHVDEAWSTGPGPADGSTTHRLMLGSGGRGVTLPLRVKAPEDWVAWEPTTWNVRISPYAKRLEAWYPLRREVPVVVSVLEPDRSVVRAPVIDRVLAAGRVLVKPAFQGDAYGRLRLRGIPHLPGELIKVRAKRAGTFPSNAVSAQLGADAEATLYLEIVLPPPTEIGFGGSGGGTFRGRSSSRHLTTSGDSRHPPKGSVTVYVRRQDGSPAAGAHVWLGRRAADADATGRAQFRRVHPGTYAVRARQVGLLPVSGTVTLAGSEAARITLTEGKGGRLQVHVVDDEGRPLAYATLEVAPKSGAHWVDLDEKGTQRVDPFTDHTGRRLLRHVEPGQVTITASWGSRSKQVQVGVTEDGSETLRVVLPQPKAP